MNSFVKMNLHELDVNYLVLHFEAWLTAFVFTFLAVRFNFQQHLGNTHDQSKLRSNQFFSKNTVFIFDPEN